MKTTAGRILYKYFELDKKTKLPPSGALPNEDISHIELHEKETERENFLLQKENQRDEFFTDSKQIKIEISEIDAKSTSDLKPSQGYFSTEDENKIQEMAAQRTLEEYQKSSRSLLKIWNEQIVHFHQNRYWGYSTQSQKPKKELTQEQKINREVFSYIWAFIQSMIILKFAVYYFGLEFAERHDPVNLFFLILAILSSFASLAFFAYRKSRRDKKLNSEK